MTGIVAQKFREWTAGRDGPGARVAIFEKIRDIPYAIVPELNDAQRYAEIFTLGKGSCTPKHFLLCTMYQQLGLSVLYVVYPFRWAEIEIPYPPELRRLAGAMAVSHHLACKVEIGQQPVLVDATLDPALEQMGLPVNKHWDGLSDTLLPMKPSAEPEFYHPSEAAFIQPQLDEAALTFHNALNRWLDQLRAQPHA